MQTRIKTIRKELGLTQTEFGESIGVKGNTVTGYETGLRTPSDAVVLAICKEYNVNEEWLRTGKGERFRQKTRHDEIAEYAAKLVGGELDEFQASLVAVLAKLDTKYWDILADIFTKMAEEYQKEKAGQ